VLDFGETMTLDPEPTCCPSVLNQVTVIGSEPATPTESTVFSFGETAEGVLFGGEVIVAGLHF
jgi:hypothetical protein